MVFKKLKSAIDKKKEDTVKPENRNEELISVNDSDSYGAWTGKGFDISTVPNVANKPVSAEDIEGIPRECSGIPYPLSNEQYRAVKNIIKWINDVSSYLSTSYDYEAPFRRLAGYAGTGKTACISYLLTEGYKYFPSYMREKEIAVCTFTWKAALVLQSRGIDKASSIHGLLYKPQENDKGELYFVRRDKFEVMSAYSMIVVDEASMVDRKMRKDIQSYGIPVLYVGDKGQLPPISNNPADALIDNNFMAEAEDSLEEINRQAKDSPIIRLSMDIRNGKRVNYGKYGKGVFKITEDELIEDQNDLLPMMSQIICGTNDCRRAANSFMRRLYGYNRKRMPVKGEKLIGLSNVLDKGLYNGQAWLCDDEDASSYSLSDSKNVSLSLASPDNSDRRLIHCIFPEDNLFKSERMSEAQIFKYLKDMEIYSVDFGYCITCHKSQGSSFDKVLVFEEKIGDRDFHKKWLYTAVTRAVSKLVIVS